MMPGLSESNFLALALSKINKKETILAIKREAKAQELRSYFPTWTWHPDSRLDLHLDGCSL